MWISGKTESTYQHPQSTGVQDHFEGKDEWKEECYPQVIHIMWITLRKPCFRKKYQDLLDFLEFYEYN